MKVKLLKKVRKKFYIERIDKLSFHDLTSPDSIYSDLKDIKLPIYEVFGGRFSTTVYQTYDNAYEKLRYLIQDYCSEYAKPNKRRDGKRRRVWWVEK